MTLITGRRWPAGFTQQPILALTGVVNTACQPNISRALTAETLPVPLTKPGSSSLRLCTDAQPFVAAVQRCSSGVPERDVPFSDVSHRLGLKMFKMTSGFGWALSRVCPLYDQPLYLSCNRPPTIFFSF